MCEINPTHKKFFRLETFTSVPNMSEDEFLNIVCKKLILAEIRLNEDMRVRFHIHEETNE